METDYIEDMFFLPLSTQAFQELIVIDSYCVTYHRNNAGRKDQWTYIWGNHNFSAAKAYKVMLGYKGVPPHFNWVWNSSCQPKHKVFFWLLPNDRLNTRNLLRRKTFPLQTYNCATLGCQVEETLHHLFWSCPFAAQCWDFICPNRIRNSSILEAFDDIRLKLQVPFFMEIIITAAWAIWMVRNDKIFRNKNPSMLH